MELVELPSNSLDFLEDLLILLSGKEKAITIHRDTREDLVAVAKEIIRAREQAKERAKANGIYR